MIDWSWSSIEENLKGLDGLQRSVTQILIPGIGRYGVGARPDVLGPTTQNLGGQLRTRRALWWGSSRWMINQNSRSCRRLFYTHSPIHPQPPNTLHNTHNTTTDYVDMLKISCDNLSLPQSFPGDRFRSIPASILQRPHHPFLLVRSPGFQLMRPKINQMWGTLPSGRMEHRSWYRYRHS